jgi:hypothetical protein
MSKDLTVSLRSFFLLEELHASFSLVFIGFPPFFPQLSQPGCLTYFALSQISFLCVAGKACPDKVQRF